MSKTEQLVKKYEELNAVASPADVIEQADILFICVKPLQFHSLLMEVRDFFRPNQLLVSITSPISVEQLESVVECKVARAIPSILNRAHSGSSLLSFGARCTKEDREKLKGLLEHISTPLEIREEITRVSSDIVSCGPAFISYLLQQFINGAVRQTDISKEDATKLTTDMIIGLGELLKKEIYTLPTLQERVCVPGGITGEGIKVLEAEVGEMFDLLFQKTHEKYEEDREHINEQFKC